MTSNPLVSRTLATLRMAELGFLGVRVMTCRQTPRRKGAFSKAGDLDLRFNLFRPLRTSWFMVGIAAIAFYPFLSVRQRSAEYIKRKQGCNNILPNYLGLD